MAHPGSCVCGAQPCTLLTHTEGLRAHTCSRPRPKGDLRLHSANDGAPLVSGRVRRCRSHALAIPVHVAYMETQAQRQWLWVMILGRRPYVGFGQQWLRGRTNHRFHRSTFPLLMAAGDLATAHRQGADNTQGGSGNTKAIAAKRLVSLEAPMWDGHFGLASTARDTNCLKQWAVGIGC